MWKLVHQGWRFLRTCGGPQRPSETHQGSSRDRPGVSALCHGRICLLADANFGISPIQPDRAEQTLSVMGSLGFPAVCSRPTTPPEFQRLFLNWVQYN